MTRMVRFPRLSLDAVDAAGRTVISDSAASAYLPLRPNLMLLTVQ